MFPKVPKRNPYGSPVAPRQLRMEHVQAENRLLRVKLRRWEGSRDVS